MQSYDATLNQDVMQRVTSLPSCRFCGSSLRHTLIDLGMSPLCESFLRPEQLEAMEPFYPLHVRVCERCFLVQLQEYVAPAEIFTEYAYFSSYSESWVRHSYEYTEMAARRFGLSDGSLVMEVGSNDGYLLQHFLARGISVLGIEPAKNVAQAATERGIPTLVEFFGADLARTLVAERGSASLIAANNVLAQVPDLNDFVEGFRILLAPSGVATFEFPHLMSLVDQNQLLLISDGLRDPQSSRDARLRRGSASDARGFAPTLCVPRRGPESSDEQPSGGVGSLRREGRISDARAVSGLRRSRGGVEAGAPGLPDPNEARGSVGRGLRRSR